MLPKALAASLVSALLLTSGSDAYVPAKRSHTPSRSSSASVRPSSSAVHTATATTTEISTSTSTGTSTSTRTGSSSVVSSSSAVTTRTTSTGSSSTPGIPSNSGTTTGISTSTGTGTATTSGSTSSSTPAVSVTTSGASSSTGTGTATGSTTGTSTGTGTGTGTDTTTSTATGTETTSGSTSSSTPAVSVTTSGASRSTGTGTATGTTTGTATSTGTGTSGTTGGGTTTTGPTGTTGTTTGATTTSTPAYLLSSFVVSSTITVPPQTQTESGTFSTSTGSVTGPPNSYSATTTTGSDNNPTILPVWFNKDGFPVFVFPVSLTGPPGIIPPPPGFPTLDIGPDGQPTPDPNNDDPSNSVSNSQPTQTQTSTGSTTTTGATTTTATTTAATTASTSTSTSATGSSTTYLIVPTETASSSDRDSFQATLEEQVGKSNVQASADDQNGVGFWRAPLNSTQVKDFSDNSIISYIAPDTLLPVDDFIDPEVDDEDEQEEVEDVSVRDSHGYLLTRRKTIPHYEDPSESLAKRDVVSLAKRATPTKQKDAVQDLVVVSQAKNTLIELLPNVFQYDPSAGKGITVYIVDSGATVGNSEYSGMPGTKRWMYPGFGPTPDHDQDDKVGHGTCVLSKVAGPQYGVAKNVDVVVVKIQADRTANGFKIPSSAFMDALLEIRSDIEDKKLQGKAVINFSFGIELEDSDRNKDTIKRLLQELNGMDVPMTVASGNSARDSSRKEVDRYPALFANDIDGIVVVGAVDNVGNTADFSQGGPLLHISAPGVKITCADSKGTHKIGSGTSYSAPQVAGLIAYFMGLPGNGLGQIGSGDIPKNVKNLLINSASYPRKSGGDKVLWNLQSVDCGTTPNKRDGLGACSISTSISGVTATSTTSTASTQTQQTVTTTGTTSVSTSASTGVSSTSQPTFVTTTTLATVTTTTVASTTTAPTSTSSLPASLTCVSPDDSAVATGVPQPILQEDLDNWCKSIDQDYGRPGHVGCDDQPHDGYFLADSSVCGLPNYYFGLQYYELAATVWFNISLAEGSAYVVNSDLCSKAMNEVLNGCAPFEADKPDDLLKLGGSVILNNGTGGAAEYSIKLVPPTAIS